MTRQKLRAWENTPDFSKKMRNAAKKSNNLNKNEISAHQGNSTVKVLLSYLQKCGIFYVCLPEERLRIVFIYKFLFLRGDHIKTKVLEDRERTYSNKNSKFKSLF